ncbi:MAG: DNA internalization-related competence protein ComEC/Rec2 [Peptostreptococcaceae bacterium]|nr:DNA internalization-related competence protein ComEC/Rec2 [Peptostreptococcaceae bacterium]
MRRPIVFIALAFSSGIVTQHLFKINTFFLVGLLIIGSIMAYIYSHKKNKINLLFAFIMITVAITGALWLTVADLKLSIISSFNNQQITGEGTVKSIVKKGEKIYKLVVVTNLIFNSPVEEKTIINYYGDLEKDYALYDLPGRKIYFDGLVILPDKRRNPNTFDYRLYLRTIGIGALIKCDPNELEINSTIEGKGNQILNYLSIIKGEISKNLVLSIGEKRSGLISGIMWGEKDNIDDDIMEQFRMNGTAHILAVSGIHIGLVYLYLNKLFWGRRNVFSDLVIIILLICYTAMANFSPSVIRAVSMIIVHIISKHTYCRYDFLCCGAVTLIIMLIMNPFSLFNIGFQLSFLAIFTLAVILPFMQKICSSFMNPIIALQFGLSPITAFTFNYFSLASLIANIPVIFLASLIIPLGLLTIPLTIFDLPFFNFHVIAHAMGYLTDAMLYINDFVYTPGKSFFYTKSPSVLFLLIYYFTLFFVTSELFLIIYTRKKYVLILKVMISILVIAILVNIATLDDFKKTDLVFVDVGQGDCLHIKAEDGKNILIDGGGNANYDVGINILLPYLLKNGVEKIDAAFVTHLHQDHYDGIAALARKGFIEKLYVYEGNIVKEEILLEKTKLTKEQIVYLVAEDNVIISRDISVKVISPKQKKFEEYLNIDEKDENSSSLILKVNIKGFSVLMTGDIDTEGESKLIDNNKQSDILYSDILKVSHHGSKYGTADEFLETVKPKVAVIQVGKNNFGHPHPSVVEKIRKKDIMLYRNDESGAIGISFDEKDKRMEIITMLE